MKTFIATLLVIFSITVAAQTPESLTRGVKSYTKSLKSDNIGIVESSVFHIAKLKLLFPEEETADALAELEKLAEAAPSETIRFKAYLATQVLEFPENFSTLEKKNYKDAEAFFLMISTELQKKLLVNR